MDFAELNDLDTFRFTDPQELKQKKDEFNLGLETIIKSAEYEDSISPYSLTNIKLRITMPPKGRYRDTSGMVIHDGIARKFSEFIEQVGNDSIAIKSMLQTLNIRLKAADTHIIEKEQEIKDLKIIIEKLQESMAKENREIQRTLNSHPQVNDIMRKPYANNLPWRILSTEQQAITRLILEIQKLNGELRITKGQNLHYNKSLKQLQKKYESRIILESDFDEMVEDNFLLEEQNNVLKKHVKELKDKHKNDCQKYESIIEEMKIKNQIALNQMKERLVKLAENKLLKKEGLWPTFLYYWYSLPSLRSLSYTLIKHSILGDVIDVYNNFWRGITLFFYNVCLIICLTNFADALTGTRRTMGSKLIGFMYFPIILILLFLIIKIVTQKNNWCGRMIII
ncbi:MAG: hypothetical protein AM1032_000003 [Mycoplasmataceae bacterium]|nr:MAG: hypothetical protein AM1032_000003 [Mycoplasmataceae bacterium]